MGRLHIFCRLEFLVFSQHDWNLTAGFSFPRTSGTNNSPIPVETLMTPLPEAYSIRDRFKNTQLSKDCGTRHGQWVFLAAQTHPSRQCHNPVPGHTSAWLAPISLLHVLISCPSLSRFIFSQLPAMCSQLAKDRMPFACIHKLPGDFYWTVNVTSLDIILPLPALGWHAKLKLSRQDAVHPSLAFGFHVGKASP